MEDFIMEDLHKILEEEDSLGDFLKMNDVDDMYKFCKEKNEAKEHYYTEEEFEDKIEDILTILAKETDDGEW